jgi:tagaturonate reductase
MLEDEAFRDTATGQVPTPAMLALPERAVQFGTGAFLRGFVDYFIDVANAIGQFNGRVVAVGSTGSGRERAYSEQDGLYTLVSRGITRGASSEERRLIGAISRVLSSATEWHAVLACARAAELTTIFSNTTEIGIVFDADDRFDASPPASFPGKLTRFLYERAATFAFSPSHGLTVVPCELIAQNGAQLRALVDRFAALWQLDARFVPWLDSSVLFCNTLVDRIGPGAPSGTDAEAVGDALGYHDTLLTTAEHFRQFVIEGGPELAERLGFVTPDSGIIIAADIEPYRQRKVRLLNGAHSISVATALLCGCATVHDAMTHPGVRAFIRRVLLTEIVPTLDVPDADRFARSVLERFENPFIRHTLFDITLHGTAKLRVRVVPTLIRAAQMRGSVPDALAFGIAAHLFFLRGDLQRRRLIAGLPVPPDELGARIHAAWNAQPEPDRMALHQLVRSVLSDVDMWGTDLSQLATFTEAVTLHLSRIIALGADRALGTLLTTSPHA